MKARGRLPNALLRPTQAAGRMVATRSPSDYCREVENYLCRKNEGHLIRIVGPSFDLVSGWASAGVPLPVAFQGIDRYFERYYRKGPRRRPVRIDFCDADVRDVFDEWRRAVGLPAAFGVAPVLDEAGEALPPRGTPVPAHLERALLKLTNARAGGLIGEAADHVIDRVNDELERARSSKGGVRGEARRTLGERLAALDAELMAIAWESLAVEARSRIEAAAAADMAPFRSAMSAEDYARATAKAVHGRVRDQLALPTLKLS
jgi:hypothetical protein